MRLNDNSYIFDNMDILSFRLFLKVVQVGTISGAAKDLSLSPASASARLVKLEEITGFRLFNRTTRAVSLTTDGVVFLPYVQQAIETLETGLSLISDKDAQPKGLLRMAMPGSFGRMYIIPALAEFQSRYPLVSLDLRLSDEIHHAIEGAFDLIIRNAGLADSNFIARKLAPDRRILVASPKYLEQHSTPTIPSDLVNHQCISFANSSNQWKFKTGEAVNIANSLAVNDGEAMRLMIENGMGIGIKSVWNAHKSLKAGRLVEVLPNMPLITESSIWALHPGNRITSPKVRVMIDFLSEQFQPIPPWQR